MNTGRKRSILPYIPGYDNNAVIKLIFFLSGAYIILAVSWAIVMLVYTDGRNFDTYFIPFIAIPAIKAFQAHPWTILTYGLFHFPNTFMKMVSDMLWLYCFGSVTQMLVGKKQIIPVFMYSIIAGGIFYLLSQLLPAGLGNTPPYILGPSAGLMGMAAAAVTLSPKYRFYITETFSIPILVVAGVFTLLMLIDTGFYMPLIIMLAGGGLTGFVYVKALKAGIKPGEWMYTIAAKTESLFTPNEQAIRQKNSIKRNAVLNTLYEPKNGVTQKRIDDILDKINLKGYNALSNEEKEVLMRAGKQ